MYKYTRKQAMELARNKGYGFKSLEKLLNTKLSPEEESQRIMMEQVPKEEDMCKQPMKVIFTKPLVIGKQEDKKEFTHKELSTPYPLDDICEIKRFILVTDGSDVVLYPEIKDMAIKLNEVIKTVNLIIKQLKQK